MFKWFPYAILKLKPHEHQNPSLLIIENLEKKNYSPNDRFLIKFFIKIISLDSSQGVPPMSPCPPLNPINSNQRVPLLNQPLPRGRLFRRETRKELPRSIWPCEGRFLIRCCHYVDFSLVSSRFSPGPDRPSKVEWNCATLYSLSFLKLPFTSSFGPQGCDLVWSLMGCIES